ncbi:MAG: xanthine dehydrogenase small subunit [Pseudomonadota bacterium]
MATRPAIRFLLNDEVVERDDVRPGETLLDLVRLQRSMTGTKEGCNEGDCGACTVLVGRLIAGTLTYQSLNACIRFVGSLDSCHVVTIEHLARGGRLHPVQQAMVDHHGSQCGFCTPGIVMSLYALWMEEPRPTTAQIETALQGNLCRCTGYEPIIKAAKAISDYDTPANDILMKERDRVTQLLSDWQDDTLVEVVSDAPNGEERLFVPKTPAQLSTLLASFPGTTIVAGATDVGLWVNKDYRSISPAAFIGNIDALQTIKVSDTEITLGAGVSYSAFIPVLQEHLPHLDELWWRIGGPQVRNMGTIGGNIANGSPIGDSPPAFIALGATVVLRSTEGVRHLPLEDFFISYGKQDRRPGEYVEAVRIPRPESSSLNAAYKISKRRDEDISALCGAFHVRLDGQTISACRIAFGGMAGTPKRAKAVEAALTGKQWSCQTIDAARPLFAEDYQPLSDWRGTSDYRLLSAQNLLTRFYLEHADTDQPVRLKRRLSDATEVAA